MQRRLTSLAALPIAIFLQGSTSCARGILTFWMAPFLNKSDSKGKFWGTLKKLRLLVSALLTLSEESWESVAHPKAPPPFPPLTSASQCSVSIGIKWPCPWSRASRPLSLSLSPLWQKKTHVHALYSLPLLSVWRIGLANALVNYWQKAGLKLWRSNRRTGESAVPPMPPFNVYLNSNHLYLL